MRRVLLEETQHGRLVRFIPPGEALLSDDGWPHKGAPPPITVMPHAARVEALVNSLHEWWDISYGRLGPRPAIPGAWDDEGEE